MAAIRINLSDDTGVTCRGEHRFVTIGARTGYHARSAWANAALRTTLHRASMGSLSIWVTPLEDLGSVPRMAHTLARNPDAMHFPIVSDMLPARDIQAAFFGLYYLSQFHPQLMGKFGPGKFPGWDFTIGPWVYAESLPLRQGCWYHMVLTWNRPKSEIALYVNGFPLSRNDARIADRFVSFMDGRETLYLGNPMMVLSEMILEDKVWSAGRITRMYQAAKPRQNAGIDRDFRQWYAPLRQNSARLVPGKGWRLAYQNNFTQAAGAADWVLQGGNYLPVPRLETTPEGLRIETSHIAAKETRMYLWSPRCFEGNDQWISFEFRPESTHGLALLVFCASGMQREDFFTDFGVPRTGSMDTIIADGLRCYHWEFFRRLDVMRRDVETQVLIKNPWEKPMQYGCVPRLKLHRWHQLQVIKEGPRIRCRLNDATVFDVTDNAFQGHGPVYNYGRIGLRHMWSTAMSYRNLSVYEKSQPC